MLNIVPSSSDPNLANQDPLLDTQHKQDLNNQTSLVLHRPTHMVFLQVLVLLQMQQLYLVALALFYLLRAP
jgi:hypothetical protein